MANGGRAIPNEDPTQDLLVNLILDQFLAQQDVTRVRDPREEQVPQGELENFLMNLIQGADPSMGVFSGLAGLTPDDPDFKTQLAIGLLTGGSLGSLLRAGGRRIGGVAGGVARSARGATSQVVRKGEDVLGSLLDRIGRGGKTDAGDIEGIRRQIFRDLVQAEERGGGFAEVDKIRTSVLEQIEELARRRVGGN